MIRDIEVTSPNGAPVTLHIAQAPSIGIGGSIWDAAITLMQYMIKQRGKLGIHGETTGKLRGLEPIKTVLCLGSGHGADALVAACAIPTTTHVIASDIDEHVRLMQSNVERNMAAVKQVNVEVTLSAAELYWGTDTTVSYDRNDRALQVC